MINDHFDGKHYFNLNQPVRSTKVLLKWLLTRKKTPWPASIPVIQQKIQRERVELGELVVTFIGHSTFLIQMDGLNILTDPVWSERASPFSFIGPKRVHPPGVQLKDLPFIDKVLLSHNHYDHLDLKTLKKLEEMYQPFFYVSKGNRQWLQKKGLAHVQEFDWWMTGSFAPNISLHFVPAQHFSARGLFDRNKTLWGGFFIKGKEHSFYFAGDTGFGPHFKEIHERLGAPTLSLLPIGAFEPREIMFPVHMNPEEAVQAHLMLKSKQSIGMHFGTFQLTDEGIDVPAQQLKRALVKQQIALKDFQVMQPGESRQI
jgi:L-ascorbate metabolism protein UlaG (beta-lactamase superfamily)